ncbi:hsp90 co-chaperone Cdc37 [Eptesicus fuscus]|uniref:hsp90 co-chaperone Cdc37 n=1 Tax=Eptesicus fuscus TaxID=29078 RepID=UPI00046B990D|nr:hsp90 co-chaperone Cdc37 [Eptesicus fuscus]
MASPAGGAYAPDRKRKGRASAGPSSSAVAAAAATASAPSEPELAGPQRNMVDYSVWDHIEVSDDEDETHPNIDTASLFRWRHQARVERMEQFQKEKEELDRSCRECKRKVVECQRKLKELEVAEDEGSKVELERLQAEAQQLRKEERSWEQKLEEMRKKEKSMPWNVDTLSKDGFSKSMVNTKPEQVEEESEEVREQKHKTFVEKYEKQIKHFGMLHRWDDSQKYLSDNAHLVCEETANYLVIWCIDLEVEEKCALMEQVAHQTIVMQFILELAKSLKVDPRACFRQFFTKIKTADRQYMEGFNDELEAFKERVRGRAKIRIEKAMKEYEEEERKKRLGPGGLDPVEVYESLPEELQKCFDVKDVQMLQDAISKMDPSDAKYHMQRCIDSGLWVPNSKSSEAKEGEEAGPGDPLLETVKPDEKDVSA